MGIFDFVKDAGEKLFGRQEKAAVAPGAAQAYTVEKAHADKLRSDTLSQTVNAAGLGVQGVRVSFREGVATIHGTATSQADREKVILMVGNTQGVARVDDQMEVAVKAPEATLYTVVAGDSLSKIAKKHYGDARKYTAIFEANRPMLKDPDKIYPGQVLRIPPAE